MHENEVQEVVDELRSKPDDGFLVEWGCGGSTEQWLLGRKPNQGIVSIEHNAEWYNKIFAYTKAMNPTKFDMIYAKVEQPAGAYSTIAEEDPTGCEFYVCPDPEILHADVFFIDGIARAYIANYLRERATKPDATFYIHDYRGRESWYDWAVNKFAYHEPIGATLVKMKR
jgi:hypothetical protein